MKGSLRKKRKKIKLDVELRLIERELRNNQADIIPYRLSFLPSTSIAGLDINNIGRGIVSVINSTDGNFIVDYK